MTWLSAKQAERKTTGHPFALTIAQGAFPEKRLHELIVKASRKYEVTVSMLKRHARHGAHYSAHQQSFGS